MLKASLALKPCTHKLAHAITFTQPTHLAHVQWGPNAAVLAYMMLDYRPSMNHDQIYIRFNILRLSHVLILITGLTD